MPSIGPAQMHFGPRLDAPVDLYRIPVDRSCLRRAEEGRKRHNLFLRWVVRPDDGTDLGLWTALSPADLVFPVDTHVARLARMLGITGRKAAGWAMAEEVTGAFRAADPSDPVRFDFALTRVGILGECTARRRGDCASCPLRGACSRAGEGLPPPRRERRGLLRTTGAR